jgi:hypothetical protein
MNHFRRRKMQESSARLELAWLVVSFVGFQIGLYIAVEYWLPQLRDPMYAVRAERLKKRLGETQTRPLSVVMLGSSRAAFGFRGGLVEERLQEAFGRPVVTCNMGCCGTAHLNELILLRRLLAKGVRPDLLMVEVTPPILAGQPHAPREPDWLSPIRFTWEEVNELEKYAPALTSPRREWLKAFPLPWYSRRFEILSWLSPQWVPSKFRSEWGNSDDPSGWSPHFVKDLSPAGHRLGVERARNEYFAFLAWFQITPASGGPLLDLLYLCRAEQIPAALVLMPEGTEFRNFYPSFAWPRVNDFLGLVKQEFSVPVINAREWIPDSGFSDSHHLLPEAATVFSEQLCREALVPLLSANHR